MRKARKGLLGLLELWVRPDLLVPLARLVLTVLLGHLVLLARLDRLG